MSDASEGAGFLKDVGQEGRGTLLGGREAGGDGEGNFGHGELGVGSIDMVMSARHLET